MILTVTANPLIDRLLVVGALRPGKIHRVTHTEEIAGGKGINVARMIKTLRYPVHTLAFIGGGYGSRLKELIELDSIPNTTIRTKSPTRFQVSMLDNSRNIFTELIDPGSKVNHAEMDVLIYELEVILKQETRVEFIVLSGSAPTENLSNLYYELAIIAHKYGKKVIMDSYESMLKKGLPAKPYCIKPNKMEAENLIGKLLKSKANKLYYIQKMWDKGIALPIVSLGKEGAVAGYRGEIWEFIPPVIKTVNATGSGDAMIGALAVFLSRGNMVQESLKWGVAAGAANVLVWKACGCSESQVRKIYPKVKVRQIK